MATVKIDRFGGIMPRIAPSLLADGMATVAHNCRLKSGKLEPLRASGVVDATAHTVYHENGLAKIADAHSVYCWKHTLKDGAVRTDFLAFPGRVYFAHGNIADDALDRIFVTGDTGVEFTDAAGNRRKNCPAVYLFDRQTDTIIRHCLCKDAMNSPRCTAGETVDADTAEDAYFFVSWFDEYGYESPASMPSRNKNAGDSAYGDSPLAYNENGTVRFQPMLVPEGARGVRIYKTNSGDATAQVQFLREFGPTELSMLKNEFSIRVDSTQAGETMPEIEAPPFDLIDMTAVPGNFYAGRARSMPHTVLFSDVDNPANWATGFRYDVRDNVVKLAVTSNSVFALTDGTPFVLSGTAPESMTAASLATPAACVSEKSVVVCRNTVFFASNTGMMAIEDNATAASGCRNITEGYFSKEQWQALDPASCVAAAHDGALYLFFAPKSAATGEREYKSYIFDLSESAIAVTSHEEAATCACTDDTTDDMYFVRVATNAAEEDGGAGSGRAGAGGAGGNANARWWMLGREG